MRAVHVGRVTGCRVDAAVHAQTCGDAEAELGRRRGDAGRNDGGAAERHVVSAVEVARQIGAQIGLPDCACAVELSFEPKSQAADQTVRGMEGHARDAIVEIVDRRVLPDQLCLRLDAQISRQRDRQAGFERRRFGVAMRRGADVVVGVRADGERTAHQNGVGVPAAGADMGPVAACVVGVDR
jgi:hypothetical protein